MQRPITDVPIVIPAYEPGTPLAALISGLLDRGAGPIIVVDDGSGPEFAELFENISHRVDVIHHAANLGKGAALKTGLNYAQARFPDSCGVVTADADGQHDPIDIIRVAERLRSRPDALTLGVREFGRCVPWKSRAGNAVTCTLQHLLVGQKLADTQSGLRGIPSRLIPHLLRIASQGYEFELDMLIACKHQACAVLQEPIRTIYLDGNRNTHFRPIIDSMRIYFLLLRFGALSLVTAALDNVIFLGIFTVTGSIAQSQITSRLCAMIFNYLGARDVVFHSQQRHAVVLAKYVALVIANGLLSYGLIRWMVHNWGLRAISAKLFAEGLLFAANFVIQRDFVFTRKKILQDATDWTKYYESVPATAKLTRRYTTSVLLEAIRNHAESGGVDAALSVVEIGGANSCFVDRILSEIPCRSYDVVDTNEFGLSLLAQRFKHSEILRLHRQSVLALSIGAQADLVFSVGLVEHFTPSETRKAIHAHFDVLRPGGIAIISFPAPTMLYRLARRAIELLGMWKFHDERALVPDEVAASVCERGEVVFEKTLWPLVLTQELIVARKHSTSRGEEQLHKNRAASV